MTGPGGERTICVELLGLARALTGEARVLLSLPTAATLGEVAHALVVAHPALVGPVLTRHGELGPGTVFSLDGREVTRDLGRGATTNLLLLTTMEGGS